MEAVHQNFISNTSNVTKTLLDDIYSKLVQLDTLWAGSPNYDGLITQGEIDEVPSFVGAGLTATQLGDAQFALATIKNTMTNAMPALVVLANLS
jgi:hypothetical protein